LYKKVTLYTYIGGIRFHAMPSIPATQHKCQGINFRKGVTPQWPKLSYGDTLHLYQYVLGQTLHRYR